MKAVVHTKVGPRLQDVEKPVPGHNEVLVSVHAATVTAGDVVMRNLPGFMFWPPIRRLLGMPPKKTTPGHEFAGVVEVPGRDVAQFKVGDNVFGTTTGLETGANAQYVCVPESWATGAITIMPANLTYLQAAAVPVGGMTALYLLRKAVIQPGEQVLIYGASGSVGTYAVQLAKHFSAHVTGVCSTRNVELVASLGADRVIDYKTEDFMRSGEAYAVVFDAVGKIAPLDGKSVLRPDGRFISIRTKAFESVEALVYLRDLIEAAALRPVIDRSYTLEQIDEAYQYVSTGRKTGNVIITVAHSAADTAHPPGVSG